MDGGWPCAAPSSADWPTPMQAGSPMSNVPVSLAYLNEGRFTDEAKAKLNAIRTHIAKRL